MEPEQNYSLSINDRVTNKDKFPKNYYKTSQYTMLSFLPMNMFSQFRRLANFFFLFGVLIQLIPGLAPYSVVVSILPFLFILSVSAVKDAYEDILRHLEDDKTNSTLYKYYVYDSNKNIVMSKVQNNTNYNSPKVAHSRRTSLKKPRIVDDITNNSINITTIDGSQKLPANFNNSNGISKIEKYEYDFVQYKSGEIEVGDIILVKEFQQFPADLILIGSSEKNGAAFINTSNLDGETNEKKKLAILNLLDNFNDLKGTIMCEQPNDRLQNFSGSISLNGQDQMSLDYNNFLPRGAMLISTKYIYGVVVYTGQNTKLSLNLKKPGYKASSVEKSLNLYLPSIMVFIVILCFISAGVARIYDGLWDQMNWSFYHSKLLNFASDLGTFFLLYSFMVPQALYVAIEICRIIMTFYIVNDDDMWVQGLGGAKSSTSSLIDELGQVEYILSDKTGTLTQNEMIFRCCTVGTTAFSEDLIESQLLSLDNSILNLDQNQCQTTSINPSLTQILHFFLIQICICNEVYPNEHSIEYKYRGESPDEMSLMRFADIYQYEIIYRDEKSIIIRHPISNGVYENTTYEIKHLLTFTSDRKRMSIIVQDSKKHTYLFSKGADDMIKSLSSKDLDSDSCSLYKAKEEYQSATNVIMTNVEYYAQKGYRTLLYSYKQIPDNLYKSWLDKFNRVNVMTEGREEKLSEVFREIEKGSYLIGLTGVEDLLQENLEITLKSIKLAGIKFAVATGDKKETALAIGRNCGLITSDMKIIDLFVDLSKNLDKLSEILDGLMKKYIDTIDKYPETEYFLITSGDLFYHCIHDRDGPNPFSNTFIELYKKCRTAILCRMTPKLKAELAKIVKNNLHLTCLAIGDGANDVSMIMEANIGVGVYGKEGRQAVNSSDFAIQKFHHLRKLLFVHGRYNYLRLSYLVYLAFFANVSFSLPQFFYSFYSGCTGQSVYIDVLMTFFNVAFSGPIYFSIGLFLQDVKVDSLMRYPQLYKSLISKNRVFNIKTFLKYMILGIFVALFSYLFIMLPFYQSHDTLRDDGSYFGLNLLGVFVVSSVIHCGIGNALHLVHYWNLAIFICQLLPIALFYGVMYFSYSTQLFDNTEGITELFQSPSYLLGLFLCVFSITFLNYTMYFAHLFTSQYDWEIVIESDVINKKKIAPLDSTPLSVPADYRVHPN